VTYIVRIIVSGLQSLSTNDTQSLVADTDIHSKLNHTGFFDPDTDSMGEIPDSKDKQPEQQDSPKSPGDPWSFLDRHLPGAFRDATYMRFRCMSQYITEDNLSEFTQSRPTPEIAQRDIRTILECLKDRFVVDAEALDRLELMRTGQDRVNLYSPTKAFLVTSTITTYLSPSWEQITVRAHASD
jgi:hypothetical protein